MKIMIEASQTTVIQSLSQEIQYLKNTVITLKNRVDELEKMYHLLTDILGLFIETMTELIFDECEERRRRER